MFVKMVPKLSLNRPQGQFNLIVAMSAYIYISCTGFLEKNTFIPTISSTKGPFSQNRLRSQGSKAVCNGGISTLKNYT